MEMNRKCQSYGEEQTYINEPLLSGFKGYVCTNNDCERDK